MKMRSLIGLFVAVAFTAGSGAVHAIKLVDMQESNPAILADGIAVSSYTYAKETLLKTSGNTTTSSDVGDNDHVLRHYCVSSRGRASGHRGAWGRYLSR